MFKRKYQYLTTIITNNKDGMYLKKVYGSEAVEKQKKYSIRLRNGKAAAIILIAVTMLASGIFALIYEPSFLADVLLSVFSGLLTGLIMLIYSGYNARLRENYNLKAIHLENISQDIFDLLKQPIFSDCQDAIDNKQITVDENNSGAASLVSQANDICKLIIKLNGNDDITWLNKKNKHAEKIYSAMLLYACIMQNRMGTAILKPSRSIDVKSIDKHEIYDYVTKTSSNLSEYRVILDRIIRQIKQQIINYDKSVV